MLTRFLKHSLQSVRDAVEEEGRECGEEIDGSGDIGGASTGHPASRPILPSRVRCHCRIWTVAVVDMT